MSDQQPLLLLHVRVRGRVTGPYELSTLRQMARRAQIGRRTEVSPDGFTWRPAEDYPAIFESAEAAAGQSKPKPETWHFSLRGVQQPSPIELATLQQYIAGGTVAADDRAWKEGMVDWAPIASIAELAIFLPKTEAGGEQLSRKPGPGEVYCRQCGAVILSRAAICPACGCETRERTDTPTDRVNGLGIAGFICGLLGLLPVPFVCLVLALIGIVLSGVGARRPPRGLAVAGIVLCTLTLAFQVLIVVLIVTGRLDEAIERLKELG